MTQTTLFLYTLLSGLLLSFIGIAIRIGAPRQVKTLPILLVCSVLGFIVYLPQSIDNIFSAPPRLYYWILLNTIAQYSVFKTFSYCIGHGPLSPAWCALNLGFITAIVLSYFFHDESISTVQLGGISAAMGCVILGSIGQKNASSKSGITNGGSNTITYGGALLFLILANGVSAFCLKDLNEAAYGASTIMNEFRETFLTLLYLGMGLCITADLLIRSPGLPNLKWTISLGLAAGFGSVTGLYLLSICAQMNAAYVFTLSGTSSIIFVASLSLLFFGEKLTRIWAGTVGLGLLSVLLTNLHLL